MIHYNNPEYTKERQNVVPLKIDDFDFVIKMLNGIINSDDALGGILESRLQRLIWHYENLVHNNEVNVPELKRLLSEKKSIQAEMDGLMQGSWGNSDLEEPHEYYILAKRKNEITEQIEKLIEQL